MNVRLNLRTWLHLAVATFLFSNPDLLLAQHTEVPPPAAYALEGVRIVDADGREREGVTIVVRGSFIEVLEPGATVPEDALHLGGGDSLVVYPGLIDAQGKEVFEFPRPEIDRSQVLSWDPPRTAQGFQPHRRAVDFLTATGSDLEGERQKGIVAGASYPTNGLMPGQGTLLLYRKGAKVSTELVYIPTLGPVMTLRGGMGYPSTLFGVLAFYRQTFEDVNRTTLIANEYSRDPRGLTPPPFDPDYDVIREVLSGSVPAFVVANSAEDIRRVLDLADNHGFRPIIVGGEEAWQVADLLKARQVPVLISLDFPEPQYWEPDAGNNGDLDPAEWREKKRLEDIYSNAARLAEAGVTFALTSGGGKADLLTGARKVIEYGLSEDAALRALTRTPAQLFGIERLIEIGRGHPATFIVSDGPLFDEDSRVVYTFVEGALERGKESSSRRRRGSSGERGEAPALSIAGKWVVEIDSDGGSMGGDLTVEQEGSTFIGKVTGTELGEIAVEGGKIDGSEISFQVIFHFGDQRVELDFAGEIDETRIRARGSSPFGPVTLVARRTGGALGGE